MIEPQITAVDRATRERWIAATIAVALVFVRSAVFVFWEQSRFDSDQAITGLMAKHLAEGRAFPVFWYGQNYMLAVEAWLAAPVFLIAGASVTALKLPLLAINIAIALVLLRGLEREVGLRPLVALFAVLFFVLAGPATTSFFLLANGGSVEPFLYVLLLWLTWERANWAGAVLAIGFLHREFTIYGLLARLSLDALHGVLFTRDRVWHTFRMLSTAAGIWLFVQWLKYSSSAAGPGTSMADVYKPHDNIVELTSRICLDLRAIPMGLWRLVTDHWPLLFATKVYPLAEFGIESSVQQGVPGSSLILAAAMGVAIVTIAVRIGRSRQWQPQYNFCAYLLLVALFSAAGYVVGRCGEVSYQVIRYELLSILGAVGLGAWFLAVEPAAIVRRTWMVLAGACIGVAVWAHVLLLKEYVRRPPVSAKQTIVRYLEAQGVRYGFADYWLAYAITFLTNERILIASSDFVRIRETQRIVEEHRGEALRISREPCEGGREIVRRVYLCK